ncbi:MAG: hypothetical protein KDJ38_12040 [Gammaproteobacteria bacterium]|nr:hypothetical protein [Gammaproteobacteria bacterium]
MTTMTRAVTAQPLDYVSPRRKTLDRRRFSGKTVYYSLVKPRRRHCRRLEDKHYPINDIYGWPEMLSAIALVVMSCTDAVFTLLLILQGGKELNPFMDYFLQIGTFEFVAAKMLITFFSIFFFVASWNFLVFSFFRVRNFLFAALVIYGTLIAYELTLLSKAYPEFY